jgi:hypothetical protein
MDKPKVVAKDIVLLALVRFLEKYNTAPNLLHKISGEEPKRDLSKFKRIFTDKNSPLTYILYMTIIFFELLFKWDNLKEVKNG